MRWEWILLGLLLLCLLLLFMVSITAADPLVISDVSIGASQAEEAPQVTHDSRDRMPPSA